MLLNTMFVCSIVIMLNLARYLFLKIHTAQIAQTSTAYTAQTMLKLAKTVSK